MQRDETYTIKKGDIQDSIPSNEDDKRGSQSQEDQVIRFRGLSFCHRDDRLGINTKDQWNKSIH